ncbi:MAG: metal-dependent transcriptional regulator [Solobacterium sp.]|nr:metal-dependent transcriptional regulator [Solobacterium sp.]
MSIPIYESSENYLEAILMIKERKGEVHSIDIAEELNFTKASVSVAMKKLRENGFITMEKDGRIHLCEKGRVIAEKTYEKHKMLTDFFISIGVDAITAEDDACKVEHDISDLTFEKLKKYISEH